MKSTTCSVGLVFLVSLCAACSGDDANAADAAGGEGGDAQTVGDGGTSSIEAGSSREAGSSSGDGSAADAGGMMSEGGSGGMSNDAAATVQDAAADAVAEDGSSEGGLLGIAAELDKMRLECPCIDGNHFGTPPTYMDKQDNCDIAAAVDRQSHTKTLGGDPNTVYDVTLHVRGNTEPSTYVKGQLDQTNQRFYVGGETSTPGYTAYMLTVTKPQQVYFFNYNPSTSHMHFLIDYEVTIPMNGGTTVQFEVSGGKSAPDGHGVSNRDRLVVPGIPPAPAPFNGQLVQFDVVSVKRR